MSFCDIDADVKPWLGIEPSNTAHDSVLTIIRDSVEKSVMEYTEQNFELNVVVGEVIDGNLSDSITPRHTPLSVEAVYLYGDPDGSGGSLLDSNSYQLQEGSIRLREAYTPKARSSVRVDYTWGYDGPPPDVKLAILQGIEAEFRRKGRKSIGVGGRSKKDESEKYSSDASAWDKKSGLPTEVVSKLNPYRVFEFPTQPMATRNK